jgi:hypothetical protein
MVFVFWNGVRRKQLAPIAISGQVQSVELLRPAAAGLSGMRLWVNWSRLLPWRHIGAIFSAASLGATACETSLWSAGAVARAGHC